MPYVLPFNYQVTGFQSVPCFYVTSPCVLTCPRCDNKPRQNNLLKGGIYFGLWLQRFLPITVGRCGRAESSSHWWPGSKGHPSSPPVCRTALLPTRVRVSQLVNPLWKNSSSLLGVSQHKQSGKMNSHKPRL